MKQMAMVFPGQGSQSVGMLNDIAAQFPEVEHTFAEASAALGYDLWKLVQQGPAEKLDQTVCTQPALLAAGVAVFRILSARQISMPAFLAGHSLGEYTALVCAQALDFSEAVKIVAARGQYMQDAVPVGVGGMAAIIGMDDATVMAICEEASTPTEHVAPANYNSIGQIAIAGHTQAVTRAMAIANDKGAKMVLMIPISVPSHCELMRPAAERLASLLATITIRTPSIPVVNNVDVKEYHSIVSIREGLMHQLYKPVRWVEIIQYFIKAGVNTVIECGPGKVLSGLNKRIDPNLELMTTTDLASLERIT